MFHFLNSRTSINIFRIEKCKVTFGLKYIIQVLYVLCFIRPRYQVSVYRTIGPVVFNVIGYHLSAI